MAANQTPVVPITSRRVRIPQHVVFRSFVSETVVLNLESGKYHGVNPTGGELLEALERFGNIGEAAADVARRHEQPVDEVERDLVAFCADLSDRGLIEIEG